MQTTKIKLIKNTVLREHTVPVNTLALHLSSFYFILRYPLLSYRPARYVTFYVLLYATLTL